MRLIRGRQHIPASLRGAVVSIGNFDGMHQGHQILLNKLIEQSQEKKIPCGIISFEPLPREYFLKLNAPPRLMTLRDKVNLLSLTQLDFLWCLRFDKSLAMLSAEDFIHEFLLDKLGVRAVVIGEGFRFGRDRQGDVDLLTEAGAHHGFQVITLPLWSAGSLTVSSTEVRAAIAQNDFPRVRALLGREYSLWGKVIKGDQRGRQLGFPTANIDLHRLRCPLSGVYAVSVTMKDHSRFEGVANMGYRPTVDPSRKKPLLEVHLFDFNKIIYGEEIKVTFHEQLRGEKKFESLAALVEQINADCQTARALFKGKKYE